MKQAPSAGQLYPSGAAWTILRPAGLYGADRPATARHFREVARRRVWLHGPTRVIVHWRNRAVDTRKARRVLGFAPVRLEEGLDEVAAALSGCPPPGS